VVNIAVQTGLKHVTKVPESLSPGDEVTEALARNLDYLQVLQSDVVSSAHQLVTACRASGQCHEDLSAIIQEGYHSGTWEKTELWDVTLLWDVITHLSSVYLMINQLLELYPVRSGGFTLKNQF